VNEQTQILAQSRDRPMRKKINTPALKFIALEIYICIKFPFRYNCSSMC